MLLISLVKTVIQTDHKTCTCHFRQFFCLLTSCRLPHRLLLMLLVLLLLLILWLLVLIKGASWSELSSCLCLTTKATNYSSLTVWPSRASRDFLCLVTLLSRQRSDWHDFYDISRLEMFIITQVDLLSSSILESRNKHIRLLLVDI